MVGLRSPPRARRRSPDIPEARLPASVCREAAELNQHVLEEEGPSIQLMHVKSLVGRVDLANLKQTCYYKKRAVAASYFVDVFERKNLRDEWMVGVLTLLDRVAVARGLKRSQGRIRQHEGLVECLACVLVVLKQSQCETELDAPLRDVILRVSSVQKEEFVKLWGQIVLKEFSIYRLLNYRVTLPTAYDLVVRISLEVCARAREATPRAGEDATEIWAGLAEVRVSPPGINTDCPTLVHRFTLLANFLVAWILRSQK